MERAIINSRPLPVLKSEGQKLGIFLENYKCNKYEKLKIKVLFIYQYFLKEKEIRKIQLIFDTEKLL